MGMFQLSIFDLDRLRRICTVIEVDDLLVLRSKLIAAEADHTVVVADDEDFARCFYCNYETRGRATHQNPEGYVVAVESCCRYCLEISLKLPPGTSRVQLQRLGMKARALRQGITLRLVAADVLHSARIREATFPWAIAEARRSGLWTAEAPPIPFKIWLKLYATPDEVAAAAADEARKAAMAQAGAAVAPTKGAPGTGPVDLIDTVLAENAAAMADLPRAV